ncbi:hypothetical protein GF336_00220 [Candidatus Woesearchaeota archaeon]|nr:hypothetical protein [Candidatus Woesearchaeota archaeon]
MGRKDKMKEIICDGKINEETGNSNGIIDISERFDERTGQTLYIVSVRVEERPDLKLGKCKIIQ